MALRTPGLCKELLRTIAIGQVLDGAVLLVKDVHILMEIQTKTRR